MILQKVIVFCGLLPIYFYRSVIRPYLPKSCNFYPTCSAYAILAIKRFGLTKGWLMAAARLFRCRPFGKRSGGYDPVPFEYKGGAKWVI